MNFASVPEDLCILVFCNPSGGSNSEDVPDISHIATSKADCYGKYQSSEAGMYEGRDVLTSQRFTHWIHMYQYVTHELLILRKMTYLCSRTQ